MSTIRLKKLLGFFVQFKMFIFYLKIIFHKLNLNILSFLKGTTINYIEKNHYLKKTKKY